MKKFTRYEKKHMKASVSHKQHMTRYKIIIATCVLLILLVLSTYYSITL